MSGPAPADDLPPTIEDALADALLRSPSSRVERIDALIAEHREFEAAIRARIAELTGEAEEDAGAVPSEPPPGVLDVGARLGPYELRSVLGRGGMGTVYLAEQREPVKRSVAVKVIQGGSREVLARFDLERQALAAMDHPGIARVFDAGIAPSGQPYFVMEYVDGRPLVEFCESETLTVEARIRVFQDVCRAVQHAHRRGVLHRDLKPANILVARGSEEPGVKVIDFGLARALDESLAGESIHTMHGQLLGTPEYMSPEQALGDVHAIDTRTDVYSLGVVLYELLSGALPIDGEELRRARSIDVARKIAESEPPLPSSQAAGGAAGLSPEALRSRLRGDLDWIVMRAMAREPERRYESPNDLALDLERHLAHEPVLAGPPSTAYRLQKFVRRHRGRVVAAALLLLSLIAGLVGTSIGLGEAREQHARAEDALHSIHEVSQWFIVDLHDQLEDLPGTMDARREIVAKGLQYLGELARQRADDPAMSFDVARGYMRIGNIQGWPYAANLGDAAGALASYAESRKILERLDRVSPGRFATLPLQADIAICTVDIHAAAMEVDVGLAALEKARSVIARIEDGPLRDRWNFDAALRHAGLLMRQGDSEGALEQYAVAESLVPEGPLEDLGDVALTAIGSLYQQLGGIHASEFLPGAVYDPERGLECFRKASEAYDVLVARHPERSSTRRLAITTQLGVAAIHRRTGESDVAIEEFRAIAADLDAALELEPNSVHSLDMLKTACEGLGRTLRSEGDLDGAVDAFERALSAFERKLTLNPDDLRGRQLCSTTMEMLAGVHAMRGDVAGVRDVFGDAIELRASIEDAFGYGPLDFPSAIASRQRMIAKLGEMGSGEARTAARLELSSLRDELRARIEATEDLDLQTQLEGLLANVDSQLEESED